MKRIVFLLCVLLLVLAVFLIRQTEKVNRLSEDITHSISSSINQLCSFYDGMYADENPSEYFENSIQNMDIMCDRLNEEIKFYYSIYPRNVLFLENIIGDYKLILRMLREGEEEIIVLHNQLHSYLEKYNTNKIEQIYEKDKAIKESDYDYELLHTLIVQKLHSD